MVETDSVDIKVKASGIPGVIFSNWSKTFSCVPELLFAPKTHEEIIQILTLARNERKHVRIVGCGHSPSDIACTQDYMISLQHMNKIILVNEVNNQVKVQAGITLKDLNEIHLPKYKLALSILGSVSDLTVGGALSTGTHGTGKNFGNFCNYVTELELMDCNGKIFTCSRKENKEIFLAAVCGLGAIGVILTVTLQCEPSFNLEQRQFGTTLKDVLEHLDVHLNGSEHFKFTWFPHTDGVVVNHVNRTKKPVTIFSKWRKCWDWLIDYAFGFYTLEFCYWLSTFYPSLISRINSIFYWLVFSQNKKRVDVSYKIFNFDCLFKQYVNEWAIPIDQTKTVLFQLKDWLDSTPDIYVHVPVEVRFVKSDDIYISPSYGRETCYINIIMYRPYNKAVPYEEYWEAYETIMKNAGGRPHWAKAHKVTAPEFTKMYPCFNMWCNIREKLDPINMFVNSYIERIFAF